MQGLGKPWRIWIAISIDTWERKTSKRSKVGTREAKDDAIRDLWAVQRPSELEMLLYFPSLVYDQLTMNERTQNNGSVRSCVGKK